MSCVHYKFSSKRKLENNTVTFDGLHITLKELKKQIMGRERLKATFCDLQITNVQTREEYTDDEVHIPKDSSVIVRRTPLGGVKPAGRTFIVDLYPEAVVSSSRPILLQTDSSPSMSLAQLAKTANLVDANASEDDKIKAMMLQSSYEYHPIHYSKKAVRPPTARHTWHRRGKAGHYIRQRPMLQMSRPLHSRQQDPLLANVTLPPPAIVPTAIVPIAAPQTQVQPPPPSPMYSTGQGEPPVPGSFTGREDQPPAHLQTAPPPEPAPPLYPFQYLYPPPPQSYPPPYTSGLLPPPFGYPTQPIYAPGPPGRNPHWIPPGVQPPHRGPPYSQPPLPKEYCYRQSHRQDKTTSKLDEFTKDVHKELMKYRNPPKRRRPSYSRSRSFSRSTFSRSVCPPSRSRSRSRSYSYSQSRSRSRSRSHGQSFQGSPYSSHNGHSYRRLGSKSRSRLRSPPPFRAGPWEGAEGPAPFRSRSRSPGGFRNRSPGGRKPPPRELPPYELKGPSPGGHARWERERHRQWEKDYRDYSPQGRGRRGREERGAPPHHPPSSSSSGTKSSTKVLKTKKVKKKRPGEEPEQTSHHSADRGDATPVRDEPMDEIPSINKTPPSSSKPASGSGVAKAPTSKSPAAPAKPSNKTVSRTQSDKTRKEKAQKVKPKVKTEAVKTESVKAKGEAVAIKKKDSNTVETNKANPEDHIYSTIPQKEKSSRVRPPLLKTPPLSSQILIPSLLPLVAPEGKDGEEQTQVKSKPRISRKVDISPYSSHNGHSYRRLGSKSRSRSRSPPPFRAGPWEGAEGPAPFRSRSRSPGGFRNRSPGGRKPPPRELPPYELKGPSPGGPCSLGERKTSTMGKGLQRLLPSGERKKR